MRIAGNHRLVEELHHLAVGIGGRVQVAVGVERQVGLLPEGSHDRRRIPLRIALDLRHIGDAVGDRDHPAGGVVGEGLQSGIRERVERALVAAAGVEDVDFRGVGRGYEDVGQRNVQLGAG